MSGDTPPEVELELDRLFAQRSGAERVRMACEMFDSARVVALTAIRAANPAIGDVDLRLALFDRLFGDDYSDEARQWVRSRLAAWCGPGTAR